MGGRDGVHLDGHASAVYGLVAKPSALELAGVEIHNNFVKLLI